MFVLLAHLSLELAAVVRLQDLRWADDLEDVH
jgi:hypothetical protein